MSEEKKINIDMNLFKVSNNRTRKKKTGDKQTEGIKIKQPSQKKKDDTLKRKSILKMIRQHQQERYDNLFDKKNEKSSDNKYEKKELSSFNKDFEEAQKFMQNLTEKTDLSKKQHNNTLKKYPTTSINSMLYDPSVDLFKTSESIQPLKETIDSMMSVTPTQYSNILLKPNFANAMQRGPQYGCLKNGNLPTYRTYMNKTQKSFVNPQSTIMGSNSPNSSIITPTQNSVNDSRNELVEQKLNESIQRVNQMRQVEQKLQQLKSDRKPKIMKRKRMVRRTYKVGKSKMLPKLSVLVSNKTIRNNITTKSQLLKQTPIDEVKTYLVKHGLIKIGTIAPNDVLRKMYEASVLMCGELQNHNSDYLLHNFINGPKH